MLIDNGLAVGGTLTMTANLSQGLKRYGNHSIAAVFAVDPRLAAPFFKGTAELRYLRVPFNYMSRLSLKQFFDRTPGLRLVSKPGRFVLNAVGRRFNAFYVFRLARYLRRVKADVIHINSGSDPIVAAHDIDVPIIMHLHGMIPLDLDPRTRRLFGRVTRFIAISEVVREAYLKAGFDPGKVSVVNNFVVKTEPSSQTRGEARRSLGLDPGIDVIGIVGRVVPWKGTREFIAAMLLVAAKRPAARFLIVGDSSESPPEFVQSLHEQIAVAGLTERFLFIPHLADPGVAYRACSVLVHASIEPEPFGMVIIEAMVEGTPVVAANFGGPAEIIDDGVSGILVEPRDAAALSGAVLGLLEKPERAERIVAEARRRVEERFSEAAAMKSLTQVYERAIRDQAVSSGRDA